MAASNFLMFSQKSSTLSVDLSEKNKAESKIIRMLPDKKTSLCLHRNTADTAVPEKQTINVIFRTEITYRSLRATN